jgi:hypothetical protein
MELLHDIQEFIAQLNVICSDTAGFGINDDIQLIWNFAE